MTERYGTIGDDLVEREAQRLVQTAPQEEFGENGTKAVVPGAKLVRREGIEPSTY